MQILAIVTSIIFLFLSTSSRSRYNEKTCSCNVHIYRFCAQTKVARFSLLFAERNQGGRGPSSWPLLPQLNPIKPRNLIRKISLALKINEIHENWPNKVAHNGAYLFLPFLRSSVLISKIIKIQRIR